MEITCQRCHETLREEDRYCPSCGLPQLIYLASETPVIALESVAGSSETMSPTMGANFGYNSGIAWRPALRVALLLAIPTSVISSRPSPIGLLCMAGAAAWAVSLYTRRTRNRWLSMGNGARIGLATGLITSWFTLAFDGGSLWMNRFVRHQGAQWDSMMTSSMTQGFEQGQQLVVQLGMATARSGQEAQFWREQMLSANFQAGMVLSEFLLIAVFSIAFAALGGAVGARLLAQPRRPGA